MLLNRYAPEVKSFALCDGQHEPYCTLKWCQAVGIVPDDATAIPPDVWAKLDLQIGGVNHVTFVLRFVYDGKDMFPKLREVLTQRSADEKKNPQQHSKARYNSTYMLQLFDIYGVCPTNPAHTKEYVPFYQGYGVAPVEPEPIRLFDAEQRAKEMAAAWAATGEYAAGKRSVDEFLKAVHNDHATDIIESMWGNLGKPFFINTLNRGSVPNLPDDALLELRSHVDMLGPQPLPCAPFPRGALALQHQVLDTHALTAEAAITGDRAILRRAMLTDPICNNIGDADACIADLLAAQRDVLPGYWYK
jgi:alpha-galactosidase